MREASMDEGRSRSLQGAVAERVDARRHAISVAAYFLAQSRGFATGHELEDWLLAERRLDGLEPGFGCEML